MGGTGAYPRREHARLEGESYEDWVARDPAGNARAWLYKDHDGDGAGEWREIEGLPTNMRGLTALDFWIGTEPGGAEFGVAGGLGQLWEWRDGAFTGKLIDRDSAATDSDAAFPSNPAEADDPQTGHTAAGARAVTNASAFRYRVKEIRIAPDETHRWVFAFTAGCCGPQSDGGSELVTYRPWKLGADDKFSDAPRWVVDDGPASGTGGEGDLETTPPQSVYSFALIPDPQHNNLCCFPNWENLNEPGQPRHQTPTWGVRPTGRVVAPDGPEPGSGGMPEPDLRLVTGDGDRDERTDFNGALDEPGPGVHDWIAGAYLPADQGLGRRGLLKTTDEELAPEFGGLRPYCLPPEGNSGSLTGNED